MREKSKGDGRQFAIFQVIFSSFVSHLQCILGTHGQHAKLIAVDLFCRRGGVEHNMGENMAESVESDSL